MTSRDPAFVTDEHRMLRDQARRFVEEEIRPHGDAWEKQGAVPREVYRKMGALGSVVLWEELAKSGYAGVSVGASVHAEMASPHLARYGTAEQKDRLMPKIVSGEIIT